MSRIDNLKKQHPELNISVIDLLGKVDPTDSYKYTEFLVKKIKEWFGGDSIEKTQLAIGIEIVGGDNVEILNEFERHSKAGRIKKNDIGQHENFASLSESVTEAEEILKQKEAEKQVIKLMDTDEYCIVVPLSYEASKIYGAGTKWCTTQEKYWLDYIGKYKLIYIIDKKTNKKYAVSRMKDNNTKIQAWLDNDEETSPFLLPLSPEVMTIITNEIKKNECVKDLTKQSEVVNFKHSTNNLMEYMRKYINNSNYGAIYDDAIVQQLSSYFDVSSLYQQYGGSIYTSVDVATEHEVEESDDGYNIYTDDEDDITNQIF